MQRFSSSAVIALCFLLHNVNADEADPIREKIESDKQTYTATMAKAKAEVIAALDKQIATARQDGKLSVLEKLKSEKEKFEADGTLPKSVSTAEYTRKLREAQKALDLGFETAIKAYVKIAKDEDAKKVEAERTEFKERPPLQNPLATSKEGATKLETRSGATSADLSTKKNAKPALELRDLTAASVRLISGPDPSRQFALLQVGATAPSANFVPSNPALKASVSSEDTGYRVAPGGLRAGATPFGDRNARLKQVDPLFEGLTLLQTKQGHKAVVDARFSVILEATQPCIVFVALDSRTEQTYAQHGRPAWLQEYVATGRKITSDDPIMNKAGAAYLVLARRVPKGQFALGAPCLHAEGGSMYFAFFAEEKE